MTTTQAYLIGKNGREADKLTKNVAKTICSTLAQSKQSLMRLCEQNESWPAYKTLTDAVYKRPWFAEMMARAREEQADYMARRTQDVADDCLNDQNITMPKVQAAKLLCENTRWYAGKILKRVYGDDQQINVDARTAVVVGDEQLKDLRARLDGAKQLVSKTRDKQSTTDSQSVVER